MDNAPGAIDGEKGGAALGGTPWLSVVVPVLDEAENVAPLIEEIERALAGVVAFEMLFVDDGSRDATLSVLAGLAATHPRLRVLKHPRRFGQSAAVRSGVAAARGTWIATLDGDGQNDPADLPRLCRSLGPEVALIAGIRRRRRDTLSKRLASRFANAVRQGLLGDGCPDTGCGLKLFRRQLFLELPYFNGMHRFLPALIQMRGGKTLNLEVAHRPRVAGRTKYGNLRRGLVGFCDLLGVYWLAKRTRLPLRQTVEELGSAPAAGPDEEGMGSCLPSRNGGAISPGSS